MNEKLKEIKKRLRDSEKLMKNEESERSLVLLGVEHLEDSDDLIWEVQTIFASVHIEIPDTAIASAVWNPKSGTSKNIIVKFIGKRWRDRVMDSKEELEKFKYSVEDYPLLEDSNFKIIFCNCSGSVNVHFLKDESQNPLDKQILCLWKIKLNDLPQEFWIQDYVRAVEKNGLLDLLVATSPDIAPSSLENLDSSNNSIFFSVVDSEEKMKLIIGNIRIRDHEFKDDIEQLKMTLSNLTNKYNDIPIIIGGDFQKESGELDSWRLQEKKSSLHQHRNEQERDLLDVLNETKMVILVFGAYYVAITRRHVNIIENFKALYSTGESSTEYRPVVVYFKCEKLKNINSL